MERLLDHRFEWILPGHSRRYHAPSAAAIAALVTLMKGSSVG